MQRREYRSGNLNLDFRETSSESSGDGADRPLPRQSRSKVAAKRLSSHTPLQVGVLKLIIGLIRITTYSGNQKTQG